MGSVLVGYTVMQQNDWAGRRFFTAQERRTGRVVYLVAEPAVGRPAEPVRHPCLPALETLMVDGGVRWLTAHLPEGDTLEDLRLHGQLGEADLVGALLAVVDGLMALSALEPPPVPSYLDPACVKRDSMGRWVLDYLALAHAPEARSAAMPPLGVYSFGVLLYWAATGQTVRRARVQLDRAGHGMPAGLAFILIRCLSRSYPSLAELRADVERAGREHEFRPVLERVPARRPAVAVPGEPLRAIPVISARVKPDSPLGTPNAIDPRLPNVGQHRAQLDGPSIPLNDRPWALPERPPEGFRRFVVPPAPDAAAVRKTRQGLVGAASMVICGLLLLALTRSGLVPLPDTVPAFLRPAPSGPSMPGVAQSGVAVGIELPADPAPPGPPVVALGPGQSEPPPAGDTTKAEPTEAPADTAAATDQPAEEPAPLAEPDHPVASPPAQPPASPPAPAPVEARPVRTPPEPGSVDDLDARQGGLPVLVHVNGHIAGWYYMVPHPTSPWISYSTFNRLFNRNLYWVPHEGGAIRLLNQQVSVITTDYVVVQGRLWLKVTPALQDVLGIQVHAYTENGMFFTVNP